MFNSSFDVRVFTTFSFVLRSSDNDAAVHQSVSEVIIAFIEHRLGKDQLFIGNKLD